MKGPEMNDQMASAAPQRGGAFYQREYFKSVAGEMAGVARGALIQAVLFVTAGMMQLFPFGFVTISAYPRTTEAFMLVMFAVASVFVVRWRRLRLKSAALFALANGLSEGGSAPDAIERVSP